MPGCDDKKSIVSFPASINNERNFVSQAMYDSIEEPLTVDFKWGTRATIPKFEAANPSLIDEVGTAGLSVNTVRFNNLIYNLYSVGLYSASHNSWLLGTKKQANTVDLILIFTNPNPLIKTKYDYIFLVVPIVTTDSVDDAPAYLSGLAFQSAVPVGGFSLSSCMPSISSQFAYYATCLPLSNSKTESKSAIVFLSLDGVNVGKTLMSSIRTTGNFGSIIHTPVNEQYNLTSFLTKGGSILSSTDITRYVLTTRVLFDTVRTKNMDWVRGASNVRTDSQTSYKCTEFDPEKNTNKDGTVTIDLTSGQILDEVMRERNLVIQSMNTLGADKTSGNVKLVPYFIGGILALLFLFSAGMVVYKAYVTPPLNIVSPIGTPASSTTLGQFFSNNSTTIFVAIICIVLGAVLGVLIALNGAISSRTATREEVAEAVAKAKAAS